MAKGQGAKSYPLDMLLMWPPGQRPSEAQWTLSEATSSCGGGYHDQGPSAKMLCPHDQRKVKEIMRVAHDMMEHSKPRTTSPLERCIKEYRRLTKPMDGFGSRQGASNFLKVWMVEENARIACEDWLSTVLN
jgi:hypothetical protein